MIETTRLYNRELKNKPQPNQRPQTTRKQTAQIYSSKFNRENKKIFFTKYSFLKNQKYRKMNIKTSSTST